MSADRRTWVPEVIQSSDTDCGPACMTSFLAGFGIHVPYDQLRDDCCTDVDGTSIDDLEDVAVRSGLDATQTLVPPEHLLSRRSGLLPAIAVLALPGGIAHFVVLWRQLGPWFQVMDPMIGRRWMHRRHLLDVLYRHRTSIPADVWREWAGSDGNVGPLRDRLGRAGVPRAAGEALLREALADGSWRSLATLDALTRLVESVAAERGRAAGAEAARLVAGFAGRDLLAEQWVPERFYSASAPPGAADVTLDGAVVVTASGRVDDASADRSAEPPSRSVLGDLLAYLRADGALAPSVLAAAAALSGCTSAFEALLFKGVLEIGGLVYAPGQRVVAALAVAVFAAMVLLVDLRLAVGVRALGRRLEARLRMDFLRKLLTLPDSFFARRLTSDLTLRVHSVVQLRGVPGVAEAILRTSFSLLFTAVGIVWIDPGCAGYVLVALFAGVGLPVLFQSRLAELQLAAATWQGGLSRYLLDALLGVLPLRSHGAQQVLRAEHDRLLARWARSRRDVIRSSVAVDVAIHGTGALTSGAILYHHLTRSADPSSVLLLVFWASQLPTLGRTLARSVFEYPARRAAGARILEPIGTPDERLDPAPNQAVGGAGLALGFQGVGLEVGHSRLLDAIDLSLDPGCHCAVVGASGAGKTSLLGLLLGWTRATEGQVAVDGRSLDRWDRAELFAQIAWVDPQIQLWNRSLYDNLTYGAPADTPHLAAVIDQTGLRPTLDQLPDGLGTVLGQGGSALSQGEGQRVRIARAMLHRDARLVLLDEPFSGLDRDTRARLLRRVRRWWPQATLLYVTHDLQEALDFDRVLVFDRGRIVEDGHPARLARQAGSTWASLLASERRIRSFFDDAPLWTRWVVRGGQLEERPPRGRRLRDDRPVDADAAG